MMLEYGKAVQESVYEQIRVVREGQLRIIFTPDLKILSWEFCARRHEELLPRRLVAPQVNQLLQIAQKCVSTIESGSDGISQQDLQTNSNMVVTAGRQLMKSLELHSLNDLGFSKRYVRSLQISEVVGSMKDLMDFCKQQKVGPIEGLKKFPRHDITTAKIQLQKMQEMEQLTGIHGQLNSNNNNTNTIGQVPFVGSPQNHHLLTRQNFMNPNQNPSPSSSSFQGQAAKLAEALQNPNANLLQQQGNGLLAQRIDPKGNPVLQQQQMMSQQCLGSFNGSGVSVGAETTRSNSFKATANSESSAAGGNTGFSKKACDDMTHDLQLSEEMVEDITKEFTDNGFFDGDLDDTLSYGWKD